jgi:tyrosine-protein phosphatase YwqE
MVFTPHVMLDGYRNTPEIIKNRLADVQNLLQENNINLEIEAAAEYYLDEGLWTKLRDKTPLLTFGDEKKYLLFESGFRNKPQGLKELVFEMQAQGYKPILAHPERYYYLHNDFDTIEDLISRGVLMQINLVSLAGFYGEDCKEVAEELINEKMVHFVGSDCHSLSYVNAIKEIRKQGIYEELAELNLLNNSLLTT